MKERDKEDYHQRHKYLKLLNPAVSDKEILQWGKLGHYEFTYNFFKAMIFIKFFMVPLKEIYNPKSFYSSTLNKAIEDFPIIKPILEKNQELLISLEEGITFMLLKAKEENFDGTKNLGIFCLEKVYLYLEMESIKPMITFSLPSFTTFSSSFFMKKHMLVVEKLDNDIQEKILHAYMFDNHWYLLLKENNEINVIDTRKKFPYSKNLFIEAHKDIKNINYINLALQEKLESIIGVEGTCGKLCLAISKISKTQTIEEILNFQNLQKKDFNFCKKILTDLTEFITKDNKGCVGYVFFKDSYNITQYNIGGTEFGEYEEVIMKVMGEQDGCNGCCNIL
jgi:hypothetical protein